MTLRKKNVVTVHKRGYRLGLICILVLNMLAILYLTKLKIDKVVPNQIKMLVGTTEEFNFSLPMEGKVKGGDIEVLNVNNKQVPKEQIKIDFAEPFTLESGETGKYKMDVKLFGFIKYKEIDVEIIDSVELIPVGKAIGIHVETDGILVLGTSPITGKDGLNYEPALNILKSGDYIKEVNGKKMNQKKELIELVQLSQGKEMTFTLKRNHNNLNVKIKPVLTSDGEYKIGTWIRDDTQGIGTLTYVDTNGYFGALGHGITDIDTNLLMDIQLGSIYEAKIVTIVKGKDGIPGELIGSVQRKEDEKIGNIIDNTNQGIIGKLEGNYHHLLELQEMKIGLKQDVELGKAYIRCQLDEEIKDYKIEIEKVEYNNSNLSKGLVIQITDPELIQLTNGIVQGMSGSPIIQNNKIIGAVTHVFIQDSTKGYGTFIENMLYTRE